MQKNLTVHLSFIKKKYEIAEFVFNFFYQVYGLIFCILKSIFLSSVFLGVVFVYFLCFGR